MKEWLKHTYGFLNIDESAVYVTKTGNWTEVTDLLEKNHKGFKSADLASKIKVGIFIGVGLIGCLYFFVSNLMSGDYYSLALIGIPITAYTLFQYMIPEYGASFVIPKNKITQIKVEENDVLIEFLDANNEISSNHFKGLSVKGLEIMKALQDVKLEVE